MGRRRYVDCLAERGVGLWKHAPPVRGGGVAQFQLYGINAAGQAAHSETLRDVDRSALRALAAERLCQWHAVEIWEGPVCLVRARRPPESQP